MSNSQWYLYVLRCGDDSLYTGVTTDVARRLAEHQAGEGARYTRAHLPVSLAAVWRFPDRSSVSRAEARFKKLRRAAKLAAIEAQRPFDDGPFAFDLLGQAKRHHFCPRCGGALEPRLSRGEPATICTVCGRWHYQNAKPCAGALVLREQRVLLVRREIAPYKGYWDIPGGFLGAQELPQAGAVREVEEETGLSVGNVEFFGIYMDHYIYQDERYETLNIYFVAEAEGDPAAKDETDGVAWFALDALPANIAFEHAPQVLRDLQEWVKR